MSAHARLRASLNCAPTRIHISYHLQPLTDGRLVLAILGHYVELASGKIRDVLLGIEGVQGNLSGENQGECIWQVVEKLGITRNLGYFTTDDNPSSNVVMEYLKQRLAHIGVPFDPVGRQIYCFRHILDRACKIFLWPAFSEAFPDHPGSDVDSEAQINARRAWRSGGPLGRLHNCIGHILRSPQRRERFEEMARNYGLDGKPLAMLIGGHTSWIEDSGAIHQALLLQDPVDDYISSTIVQDQEQDESSLVHDKLSPHDWDVISMMQDILEPFDNWVTVLESKRGVARLADVIPAYEELMAHLETHERYHLSPNGSPHIAYSILKTGTYFKT